MENNKKRRFSRFKKHFFIIPCTGIFLFLTARESFATHLKNGQKDFFIENKGQWDSQAKYLSKQKGYNYWITSYGLCLDLFQQKPLNLRFNTIHEKTEWIAQNEYETFFHYFIGNDPSRWATFVKPYAEVYAKDPLQKIVTRFYFENEKPRFDFMLAPDSPTDNLYIEIENHTKLYLDKKNKIHILQENAHITMEDIHAYQFDGNKKIPVPCRFTINGNKIHFALKNIHKDLPLIIDPAISTWVCGDGDDLFTNMDVHPTGVLICGQTYSTNFPTQTPSNVSSSYHSLKGNKDAFVSKLSGDLSSLLYSIYLGGNITSNEQDRANAVKEYNGKIYVTGKTSANSMFPVNFPLGSYAYSSIYAYDPTVMFFSVIDPTLNASVPLIFSGIYGVDDYNTYFEGIDLEILPNNKVILLGNTNMDTASTVIFPDSVLNVYTVTFLLSPGANVTDNFFLIGLEPSFKISKGMLVGGDLADKATDMSLNGNTLAITGGTFSTNLPVSPNAFQSMLQGIPGNDEDAFVMLLKSFPTSPFDTNAYYFSYLGGSNLDHGSAIAYSSAYNKVYVAGHSASNDFPTTGNVLKTTKIVPSNDGFITCFSTSGPAPSLEASTYFGSDYSDELIRSIDLTPSNELIFATNTTFTGIPPTPGASDSIAGSDEILIGKISPSLDKLMYLGYLGGSAQDHAQKIQYYSNKVYVTGNTYSLGDFPFTNFSSYQQWNPNTGNYDGFITLFENECGLTIPIYVEIQPDQDSIYICKFDYLYTNTIPLSDTTKSFLWQGTINPINDQPSLMVLNDGWHYVYYHDLSTSCWWKDSIFVTLKPSPDVYIVPTNPYLNLCQGDSLLAVATGGTYIWWVDANGSIVNYGPYFIPPQTGPYGAVTINSLGCTDVDTVYVALIPSPSVTSVISNSPICQGDTLYLIASPPTAGYQYSLQLSNGNAFINYTGSFVLSPAAYENSGSYTLSVKDMQSMCQKLLSGFYEIKPLPFMGVMGDTIACKGSVAELTASGNATYYWNGLASQPNATIRFTANNDTTLMLIGELNGCYDSTTVSVKVKNPEECIITTYSSFSPNGDGINDYWHIDGIEFFDNVGVEIYNRWGVLVWSTPNYNNKANSFTGRDHAGKKLPPATYFYLIKTPGTVIKGYVEIIY